GDRADHHAGGGEAGENGFPALLALRAILTAVGSGRGKPDLHGEAALGTGLGEQGGVVGGGDSSHDREAEAVVAVAGGGAVGAEALEGLEEALHLGGRDEGAVVGYGEEGAIGVAAGPHPNPAAGDVVADGVVDQVADEALREGGVACGGGGLDLGL